MADDIDADALMTAENAAVILTDQRMQRRLAPLSYWRERALPAKTAPATINQDSSEYGHHRYISVPYTVDGAGLVNVQIAPARSGMQAVMVLKGIVQGTTDATTNWIFTDGTANCVGQIAAGYALNLAASVFNQVLAGLILYSVADGRPLNATCSLNTIGAAGYIFAEYWYE